MGNTPKTHPHVHENKMYFVKLHLSVVGLTIDHLGVPS